MPAMQENHDERRKGGCIFTTNCTIPFDDENIARQ
jgi:hypothetical protein